MNLFLAAGISCVAMFGSAGAVHAAAPITPEINPEGKPPAIAHEASVAVTASVALSDYFANLVATLSIVETRVTPEQTVELAIQIRSDEQLVFPKHPLTIEISQVATGEGIKTITGMTGKEGRLIHTLNTAAWQSGLYRIHVTDLAYARPIPLATQPIIYVAEEDDRSQTVALQSASFSNSFTAAQAQNVARGYSVAAGDTHSRSLTQLFDEPFRHHYPRGHDP